MARQLALNVGLADVASFDNYFLSAANREVVHALSHITKGDFIFLYGDAGAGKTHLLHAALRQWLSAGGVGRFWSPARASGQDLGLTCIDDGQAWAGQADAERALFNLYEAFRSGQRALVMAADKPPNFLPWRLPDLLSRLTNARVYRLTPLADADLSAALQLRARSRGFELPAEVVAYILRRYQRDSASLFGLLDLIDSHTLAAGRRVTLPFLRELEQRNLA